MKRYFLLLMSSLAVISVAQSAPVTTISTPKAPQSLGAYSQGIMVDLTKGKLVFVSGQVAIDPKTGKLREETIQTATRQTLDNIGAILKAAGSDWQYVVRMDVFLKDFNDWDGMNEIYSKRFTNGVYPVRQTVQVGMENRVEISAIAFVPNK